MNETRSFEHAPESVAAARRFAADLLAGVVGRDALEAITLMVSELATNCIRYTDSGFDLTIIRDSERIRVEATDQGVGAPRMQSPKPTDPSGRGLQIVEMLSTDWGCDHGPDIAKTVWFTIDARAGSARDADHRGDPRPFRARPDQPPQVGTPEPRARRTPDGRAAAVRRGARG